MARLLAGIGELHVSHRPEDTIVALGLGSCVAVILFDPRAGVGGMAHCMLPERRLSREDDPAKPAVCVAKGFPTLLERMRAAGANPAGLLAVLIGGASMFEFGGQPMFDIGADNATIARRLLAAAGIRTVASELGGKQGRTATLHVSDGTVSVRSEVTERTLVTIGRLGALRRAPAAEAHAAAPLRRAA